MSRSRHERGTVEAGCTFRPQKVLDDEVSFDRNQLAKIVRISREALFLEPERGIQQTKSDGGKTASVGGLTLHVGVGEAPT